MFTPIDSSLRRGRAAVVPALLALVAGWFLAGPASAQGTGDALPDPISDSVLSAYARRLELSDQQRLAIDSFHRQYLDDFRRLREREIEQYIQESGDFMRAFFTSTDVDEVRRNLRQLDRLMDRIRSLDERLFSQIQTLLSEEQAPDMQRVRQMRERARYRTGLVRFIGFSNPGARVDLSELVMRMDLSPRDREAIEPMLLGYERQLTAAARKTYDAATEMFLNVVKQMEELAAQTSAGGGDREVMRRRFRSMRDIWAGAAREVMAEASKISQLNRRSCESFTGVLSDDAATRLVHGYYEVAYSEVLFGMLEVLGKYDSALRLTGLTEDQHARLEAARDDLRRRHEQLARKMIDLIEEMRASGGFFVFRSPRDDPNRQKLETLQEQRDELNAQALETLAAILGPDLRDRLDQGPDGGDGEPETVTETATVAVVVAGGPSGGAPRSVQTFTFDVSDDDAGSADFALGPDPYLPGPISARELDACAARLAISDDERPVLNSFHADYLDGYEDLRETDIRPVLDAQQRMWSLKPDSDEIVPPSADAIDELFALRRKAFQAIMALDESFFENVELAFVDADDNRRREGMTRVRLARQRIVYNRGEGTGPGLAFISAPRRGGNRAAARAPRRRFNPFGIDSNEAAIDLALLVDDRSLAPEELDAVEPALLDYEQQIADAFKQRYEIAFQHAQATERLQALAMAARRRADPDRPRGGPPPVFGSDYRQLMETSGRRLEELEGNIIGLNRNSLDSLISLLPSSSGASLRSAYRRQAYPGVYRDPGAAEPHLVKALALEDLTENQRSQVNDILADYREPYSAFCETMADLHAEATRDQDVLQRGPEVWEKIRQRRNDLEKLRFDRNELNEKTLRRLRAILTDEQIQRLGLGPDE